MKASLKHTLLRLLSRFRAGAAPPLHIHRGRLGEQAAQDHLRRLGMKCLATNFRSRRRGEIDIILRHNDCLVFAEVKTRSEKSWLRPAAAVNARKRRLLTRTAFDYLKKIGHPETKLRFDIVEVLLQNGQVQEIRHLPNSFILTAPYRYG